MIERLIIKNFLCLKNVDIEVKDFLVLIGPQAAGKSLCAKLLYFFRTIFDEIPACSMKSASDMPSDFSKDLLDKFELFFPKDHWVTQAFYMEYERQSRICKLEKKQNQELRICLGKISQEKEQSFQTTVGVGHILKMVKGKPFASKNIFIPDGRSFFSLLQKNIFRFMQTNNNIDPFLTEFGVFYEDIRSIKCSIPAEAQTLIRSILKGEYVPEENLLLAEGRKIPFELLSSGQQEALPLALISAYIISSQYKEYYTFIYVEEPEAHLFPDAQEAISRLISFVQHNSLQKTAFVITTHSPFMLAAFNNLIKAGNIVKQNPPLKEAVCKEIPESMYIDIDRFAVYSLEDGRAVSIIDKETNLIGTDAIDEVSEDIMEIFSGLLDIEYNGKDERGGTEC
jgi:ABC-type cobalamin/Fe3+-siderophores transport system ATPase subunit